MRRTIAALGAAALIGGLLAAAPTAANAASSYTITGKVTFAANPKLKLSKGGYLAVYNAKCDFVGGLRVEKQSWKGNRYTLKLNKAGTYRVVFYNSVQTKRSPYGLQSEICVHADKVRVGTKKPKAVQNLAALANGRVAVKAKSLKHNESIVFYDATTKKPVFDYYYGEMPAGSYKIAKAKWSNSKKAYVVLKVFGTSKRSLGAGTTVRVKPAKAILVNFDKRTVKSMKDFSYRAKVSVRGSSSIGSTLTAATSGFPAGTRFTYEWARFTDSGYQAIGTGRTYKVGERDGGAYLSLIVVAKKRGYLDSVRFADRSLAEWTLTQTAAPLLSGVTDGVADPGTDVSVSGPAFAQSGVTTSYSWQVDGQEVGTGTSFATAAYAGRSVTLVVTSVKPNYAAVVTEVPFQVAEEAPPVDQ